MNTRWQRPESIEAIERVAERASTLSGRASEAVGMTSEAVGRASGEGGTKLELYMQLRGRVFIQKIQGHPSELGYNFVSE